MRQLLSSLANGHRFREFSSTYFQNYFFNDGHYYDTIIKKYI